MTLIEFLTARLDEDETAAWEAGAVDGLGWMAVDPSGGDEYDRVEGADITPVACDFARSGAVHVARHDPGRALREVRAKRILIERLSPFCLSIAPPGPCGGCEDIGCVVLRDLAAVYSLHQDYQQATAA